MIISIVSLLYVIFQGLKRHYSILTETVGGEESLGGRRVAIRAELNPESVLDGDGARNEGRGGGAVVEEQWSSGIHLVHLQVVQIASVGGLNVELDEIQLQTITCGCLRLAIIRV